VPRVTEESPSPRNDHANRKTWACGATPGISVLDPRRLRALREVHARGSIAAAAQALGYTASAVSQSVAAMERYLDLQLLERTSRGVILTPAGLRLVEHADVILAHLDAAEREARALRSHAAQISLTLATFASGADLVVRAATELAQSRANTELRIVEADPGYSLPELRSGNVDVALTYVNDGLASEPPAWMEEIPLLTEPVLAILPERHPLAGRDAIRLVELAGERFIAEPAADHRPFTVVACHGAGFEPQIAGYSSNFALTAALVARGGAVALLPRMALREPTGVAALPLSEPKLVRRVFAVTRVGNARVSSVAALLGALRRAAALAEGTSHS
jgi:molybdate transport repressor ModE-like protein